MLRLPPARRVFAALFAPWFAVVTAEPAAVHECALHSPVAAHATAPTAGQGTAHDHSAMMHHAAGSGSASMHGAPVTTHHHAHRCSCPDGCCAASTAMAHREVPLSLVSGFVLRTEPPFRVAAPPRADADHVLPFANAPPARS